MPLGGQRPLAAHYLYAFADGTYFTVIYEEKGIKMAVLSVVGIGRMVSAR